MVSQFECEKRMLSVPLRDVSGVRIIGRSCGSDCAGNIVRLDMLGAPFRIVRVRYVSEWIGDRVTGTLYDSVWRFIGPEVIIAHRTLKRTESLLASATQMPRCSISMQLMISISSLTERKPRTYPLRW